MGLFNFLGPSASQKRIDELEKQLSDIRLQVTRRNEENQSIQQAIKIRRRTLSKPLAYSNPTSSGIDRTRRENNVYHGPFYDLSEVARAMDVEPYVNQSVRKHREQILKEGYIFKGEDEEMVDYIHRRIFEMELVSGVTFEEIVRDFTTNLVAYATTFLVTKRDPQRSSGKSIKVHGKTLKPIAAIFPMDPTSVEVRVNKHGHPTRWKQRIPNSISGKDEITFPNSDVIYATIDRKPGFIFGTPYILPTLDDVRALRRLEELAEVAVNKFAFPSLHFQVGEKDDPPEVFDDGSSEIDMVRVEVENMNAEGGIVTSHRVKHEVMGSGTDVIDINPYLQYFEGRVLGGLRLSEIDLGRGDVSKASAQTVSASLQDSAKDFQAIISNCLTYKLVLPLLFEGGFDVNEENIVRFQFPLIDREEERANQAHGGDMFNNGTITCTEFRKEFLGKREISEEQKKDLKPELDFEKEKELAKMQAQARAQQQSQAAKNTTANKSRPSNQSGRKSTKTRVTANSNYQPAKEIYLESIKEELTRLKSNMLDFVKKHGVGVASSDDPHDCTTKAQEMDTIFESFVTFLLTENRSSMEAIIKDGQEDCMDSLELEGPANKIPKRAMDRFFKNYIIKSLNMACGTAKGLINADNILAGMDDSIHPAVAMSNIIHAMLDDLTLLASQHIDIAYRFGYARTARIHDQDSIILSPTEGACPVCIENGDQSVTLSKKDIPYSVLLKTHSDCAFDTRVATV